VKEYICKYVISEGKAVSMTELHEIYGLGVGDKRYRGKLKKRIEERFPDDLIFVTAKVNNPEVVISQQVFKNSIHHSIDRNATVVEAASLIREDIKNQYKGDPVDATWPPNLSKLQELPVPDSVKTFFRALLTTEKHGAARSEKSDRLIESFSADLITSVTNGSVLTAKHYLLAVGLHSKPE